MRSVMAGNDPTQSTLFFRDESHVDPWRRPKGTIVPLHGIAETGLAWGSWVPAFSREYRLVVPDLPGFGRSANTPKVSRWTIEELADVVAGFMRDVGVHDVHLIGAKLGGSIALGVAARHPDLVRTLTVVGSPVNSAAGTGGANISEFGNIVRRDGLRNWAANTMRSRLGSHASDAQMAWWTDYMAAADVDATLAYMASAGNARPGTHRRSDQGANAPRDHPHRCAG